MEVPTAMTPHRVVIVPPLMRLQLKSSGSLEKDSISRTDRALDGLEHVTPDQSLSQLQIYNRHSHRFIINYIHYVSYINYSKY